MNMNMDTNMRRKVRAALRRGKVRIADQEHWLKDLSAQDETGRESDDEPLDDEGPLGPFVPVNFCAAGAIDYDKSRGMVRRHALAALDRAALALDPTLAAVHGSAASAYNDARTHAEVMVLYDVALALVGAPPPAHDCDTCQMLRRQRAAKRAA